MNFKFRPAFAELVGTFAFVFVGAGSVVADQYTGGALGLIGVALAHGLLLAVLVSAFLPVSGAHFNPAVSLGTWVAKKTSTGTFIIYVAAQLFGAGFAGLLLRGVFPAAAWTPNHLGTPTLALGMNPISGFALELILSIFLMLAYLGTTVDPMAPKLGGLGIGCIAIANILLGLKLSGGTTNPARAFGPALASGFWEFHWIYWVAPFAGAAIASWIYTRLISETV